MILQTLLICLCLADILFFFFCSISSSFFFVYSAELLAKGLCSSSYPSSMPYHSRSSLFCSSSHSSFAPSLLNSNSSRPEMNERRRKMNEQQTPATYKEGVIIRVMNFSFACQNFWVFSTTKKGPCP